MIIEKNNIEVPLHLDEKFFKESLEHGLRENDISIKSISFEMGSSSGENYCSEIYRVRIEYKKCNNNPSDSSTSAKFISLIIKSIPINEANQFLLHMDVFRKEKIIYYDVIPRIEILVNSSSIGAKCFYTINEPIKTIVFEDLCSLGFRTANRQRGLDEDHCRLVLSKLAKFHAGSMVLAKKCPSIVKNFNSGMFNSELVHDIAFKAFFSDNMEYLTNEVSNWRGFEVIAEKLKNINRNLRERCLNVTKPRNGEVKVLNHGDLWVNNIMFKYDEENNNPYPSDVMFVDFQMSYFSSPGIDLNYFFNTSVQLDVLKNRREQLIRVYHQALEATLNELGYKEVPTFNDIKLEVREMEFYGLVTGVALFPLIIMEKEQSQDNSIESLQNEEIAKKKRSIMFASQRCQDTFKYSLKRFNDLGVLE